MSSYLSAEQRRFQSIKKGEARKKECVDLMFSLAGELKRKTGAVIDDRQALVLYNVAKTLEMKKRKGVL